MNTETVDFLTSDIGKMLKDNNIDFMVTRNQAIIEATISPKFEYFIDEQEKEHGEKLAVLDYYWLYSSPSYILVKVTDYNKAIDLTLELDSEGL